MHWRNCHICHMPLRKSKTSQFCCVMIAARRSSEMGAVPIATLLQESRVRRGAVRPHRRSRQNESRYSQQQPARHRTTHKIPVALIQPVGGRLSLIPMRLNSGILWTATNPSQHPATSVHCPAERRSSVAAESGATSASESRCRVPGS